MRIKTTTTGLLRVGLGLLGFLLLSVTLGCNHDRYGGQPDLSRRILPPPNVNPDAEPSSAKEPPRAGEGNQARKDQAQPPDKDNSEQARSPTGAPETDPGGQPGQPLDLLNAIALAFRLQPQLRAALEKIQQAQGREDIVFSTFLPLLTSGYLAGGYHIQAGGDGFPISADPNSPKFTILPLLGSIPVGLQGQTGFEVAELKLQWLVCDFGRRLGLYRQADIAVDIAQLQTQRAYQTVANEVAVAYYHLLRARSLHRIATESVRRGEDDLDVARKLKKEGVIEKEKVLRAEVALSQAQQSLDKAEEAEAVAIAALNLAIGLNVSEATRVVDTTDVPPFPAGLVDCLRIAVDNRREFQVVRRAVQAAQEGSHVARADFAPRIVAEGALLDYQQANPRGHFDFPFAFIGLEWSLFEGGRRVAEVHVADSRVREAMAQAESIADTIAFQVNEAFRQMVAARKGIDRSRPAVDQTRETYRLVVVRSRQGDSTPQELTDAQTGLTRAEQDYANAIYDYLTAFERLQYAMGISATPGTIGSHP